MSKKSTTKSKKARAAQIEAPVVMATESPEPAKGKKAKTPKPPKAPKPLKEKKPSGLDAAAQVLKASGGPMRCKDVVDKMLSTGLWTTGGATPAATIYAAMHREIKTKGKDARFTKTDRGMFEFNAQASGGAKES